MNTLDQAPAGHKGVSAPKRAYQTPQVIELGDVREITRGGGGTSLDGKFAKNAPQPP